MKRTLLGAVCACLLLGLSTGCFPNIYSAPVVTVGKNKDLSGRMRVETGPEDRRLQRLSRKCSRGDRDACLALRAERKTAGSAVEADAVAEGDGDP